MNFIIGAVFAIIGAIVNAVTGNWTAAVWCVAAAGWAAIAYVENRDAKRYKVLALARSRSAWLQPGTYQRTREGGREVWDGQKWVKV